MSVTKDIKSLIPHRKPFLFVDEILSCDAEGSVSEHIFTEDEFFFEGHFPEYPVVPGVILVETMAQAGGAALSYQKTFAEGSLFFLATV
ncbi:MAG TPA: beta-hydroxyacyl-ACP dehydratase, partial [Treponemataceae bacterium]|nr:beta-hydroxyacyl-ACP dehydratase [Treponemataceae bacterium]